MRAIGAIAAHRLHAGWRGWAALALLIGLAGGAVLAAAAGARRTESAFPRFLRGTAAASVLVGPARSGVGGFDLAIGKLPGVTQIAPVVGLNSQPVFASGKLDEAAQVVAPLDGRLGHQLERPRMLAGRQPLPGRADEVMVDQIAAATLHLHVGSTLRLAAVGNRPGSRMRHLSERVVGIEVIADSIVPVNKLAQTAYIQASAALYRALGPNYQAFDGDYVQLAAGTTVGEFTAAATHLAREPLYRSTGGQLFVSDESVQDATVERSIRPQAAALALFALVLAVTALLVVGQAASRLMLVSSADNQVLAALGLTRWQLLGASLVEASIVIAAGAVLACGVAIAGSPLMPIGPARLAELHPGVSVDATVLIPGFAAIVLLLVGRIAWTAWRESSARLRMASAAWAVPGYGSRVVHGLARSGASVALVTGVRMALDPGRGRTAVRAFGAVTGIALSVAAIMGSLTFGANLLHLERTPRLYGQTWDAAMDLQFSTITSHHFDRLLKAVPGVQSWTFGLHGTINLGRHGGVVPAVGLAAGEGRLLTPTMLAGQLPGAGQVVLGTATMRAGGIQLGQVVEVSASGQPVPAKVVGRAVFPYFGQGSFTPTDLGRGALVPAAMLAAQAEEASGPGYNFVLLSFAPGPRKAADIAAFSRAMAGFCSSVQQSTCVVTNQQPNGVIDYRRIDETPLVLAGLVTVLGLAVLAQFMFQSARSRRRDFAVFRTLGLRRGQLIAVTCWQVTTLTGLALLAGLAVGVAAGHLAWALFADVLGVSPGTTFPVAAGLLIVPAALLAANAIGFWPARRSARIRPAELLRTD
jgi:FtsX-like permease family/MacB-like periplasmic core domain